MKCIGKFYPLFCVSGERALSEWLFAAGDTWLSGCGDHPSVANRLACPAELNEACFRPRCKEGGQRWAGWFRSVLHYVFSASEIADGRASYCKMGLVVYVMGHVSFSIPLKLHFSCQPPSNLLLLGQPFQSGSCASKPLGANGGYEECMILHQFDLINREEFNCDCFCRPAQGDLSWESSSAIWWAGA